MTYTIHAYNIEQELEPGSHEAWATGELFWLDLPELFWYRVRRLRRALDRQLKAEDWVGDKEVNWMRPYILVDMTQGMQLRFPAFAHLMQCKDRQPSLFCTLLGEDAEELQRVRCKLDGFCTGPIEFTIREDGKVDVTDRLFQFEEKHQKVEDPNDADNYVSFMYYCLNKLKVGGDFTSYAWEVLYTQVDSGVEAGTLDDDFLYKYVQDYTELPVLEFLDAHKKDLLTPEEYRSCFDPQDSPDHAPSLNVGKVMGVVTRKLEGIAWLNGTVLFNENELVFELRHKSCASLWKEVGDE